VGSNTINFFTKLVKELDADLVEQAVNILASARGIEF